MRAYKVVRSRRATLSFFPKSKRGYASYITVPASPGENAVLYNVNQWTRPIAGSNPYLFVFRKLSDAIRFTGGGYPTYDFIFLAEVVVPTVSFYHSQEFPDGTLLVSAVKLLRRVK